MQESEIRFLKPCVHSTDGKIVQNYSLKMEFDKEAVSLNTSQILGCIEEKESECQKTSVCLWRYSHRGGCLQF